MALWEGEHVPRLAVEFSAIGHGDVENATDLVLEVRRFAEIGASDGLDVLRPAPSGLEGEASDLTPTDGQEIDTKKLSWIQEVNTKLYRAYLMKEQLRIAIRTKGVLALTMLEGWLSWFQRSRISAFVELGRKIKRNLAGIEVVMLHKLSNALIESTNTKLRVLDRMAFGFKKPEHLIALALLDRGGYCPPLPGRGHSSAPALAALG